MRSTIKEKEEMLERLAATIGDNVKRLREEKKIDIMELCFRSGINEKTISQIENGLVVNPTLRTLLSLAAALEVTIPDLIRAPYT